MSKRFRIVAIAVGVLCAALIAWTFFGPMVKSIMGGGGKGFQRPPVTVSASPVVKAPWTPTVEAVGTVRANQGADLSAQVAGVVKAINFTPNQRVEKGQLLVQIDDAIEQSQMIAARANIQLYTAQLARWQKLNEKGYATAESGDVTRSQLQIARSELARLQATAEQKAIRAPFAGVVGIARINVGQFVPVGTALVTLQDLDQVKVDFTVPEGAIAVLKPGLSVQLGLTPDTLDYAGELVGIDPKVDPATRLANAQAVVANEEGKIAPGAFLRVQVQLPAQEGVLQLPQTAIMPSLYGDAVYVASKTPPSNGPGGANAKGGMPPPAAGALFAKQVFVKTGRRFGDKVEILSGLDPGDVVVWAGQNKLQNGTPMVVDNSVDPAVVASSGRGKYR